MNERTKNNPIPIEAAVKYLVRDRDRYKAKLEQLIPYAKDLERRIAQAELPDGLADAWAEVKSLKAEVVNLKNQVEMLRNAKNAFRKERDEYRSACRDADSRIQKLEKHIDILRKDNTHFF